MKWLTVEVDMMFVGFWGDKLLEHFRRFGFGEAMASKSRRTEVPWNPTDGGVSSSTSSVSDPSIVLASGGLSRGVDV